MNKKVLIVEDQFVEANDIQLMLKKAGYEVCGIARSVIIARELIKKEKPALVLLDIFLKGDLTGIDLARELREENIAFIYLSANSNEDILNAAKTTEPYGFIVKPFREKDLLVTLEIAQYRHEHSRESYFRKENIAKDKLTALTTGREGWEEKLLNISRILQSYISFDFVAIGFNNPDSLSNRALSFLRIGYDEYQTIGLQELQNMTGLSTRALAAMMNSTSYDSEIALFNEAAFEERCKQPSVDKLFATTFQMKSQLSMPIQLKSGELLRMSFYSRKSNTFNADHSRLLEHIQKHLSAAIYSAIDVVKEDNAIVPQDSDQLDSSEHAMNSHRFQGIIGKSHLLLNVFDLITQVAYSNTSVLIFGESGTGKELIADCIHNLSPRREKPFVKVNCAALPATLIESELFGHEKGAFTGAHERRIGKFEKADRGTIFLDEIGEMPLDLQVKLLRVLQEKYIERIGAKDLTKIDVRIIAATNRSLEKEVAEGRFRLDLYYRLNVFPIEIPPLRERIEDISALANHFIAAFSQKLGKKITSISDRAVKEMMAYHWPGNIRELENLIERSVLLTKGTVIDEISISSLQKKETSMAMQDYRMKTIHENERDYIIAILKKCNGKIWGSDGAAEVLNIPPSTLKSKMKKLGIRKESYIN